MIEFVTDKNPIRNINTGEVKLSEKEIQQCVIFGIKKAYSLTSNPCVTSIEMEIFKAVKIACNKPKIS